MDGTPDSNADLDPHGESSCSTKRGLLRALRGFSFRSVPVCKFEPCAQCYFLTGYYAFLGLKGGCAATEIKTAYRDLALKHHPDKGGEAEIFQKLRNVYYVLADERRRSVYDQFGTIGGVGKGD